MTNTTKKYDFLQSPDFEGEELEISAENQLHHWYNAIIHDFITDEGNFYFSIYKGRGNKSEREDRHAKNCRGCKEYEQALKKIKSHEQKIMTTTDYSVSVDNTYYDLWCVEPTGNTDYNHPRRFHFVNREDAEAFKEIIKKAVN